MCGFEAQSRTSLSLGVRGQVEQPVRLVVGEQQPALAADDDHALPHGVQHRVVVLVHAGHLGRAEAVGLAQEPLADECRARRGQGEGRRGGGQHEGQLLVRDPAHVLGGDPGRHQAHDLAVGVLDRHHGLDERAEGAVDLLGEGLALQRRAEGADELLADAVRLRMGVADPVGVHHDDEVHLGLDPGGLGPRLEHRRRIVGAQRLPGARRVGERLRHGERTVVRFPCCRARTAGPARPRPPRPGAPRSPPGGEKTCPATVR